MGALNSPRIIVLILIIINCVELRSVEVKDDQVTVKTSESINLGHEETGTIEEVIVPEGKLSDTAAEGIRRFDAEIEDPEKVLGVDEKSENDVGMRGISIEDGPVVEIVDEEKGKVLENPVERTGDGKEGSEVSEGGFSRRIPELIPVKVDQVDPYEINHDMEDIGRKSLTVEDEEEEGDEIRSERSSEADGDNRKEGSLVQKWRKAAVSLQGQIRNFTFLENLKGEGDEVLPEIPRFTEGQLLDALKTISIKKSSESGVSYIGDGNGTGLNESQLEIIKYAEGLIAQEGRQTFAENMFECIKGLSFLNCVRIFVWPIVADRVPEAIMQSFPTLPIEVSLSDLLPGGQEKPKSIRASGGTGGPQQRLITPELVVSNILREALDANPIEEDVQTFIDPKNETLSKLLTPGQLNILKMAERFLPKSARREYSDRMYSCIRRFEYFSCVKYFAWPMVKQHFPALPEFPDYESWYPSTVSLYPGYPIVPFPDLSDNDGQLPEVIAADSVKNRTPRPETLIVELLKNTVSQQPRQPAVSAISALPNAGYLTAEQLASLQLAEQLVPLPYRAEFITKAVQCIREYNYLICTKYSIWPVLKQWQPDLPEFPDVGHTLGGFFDNFPDLGSFFAGIFNKPDKPSISELLSQFPTFGNLPSWPGSGGQGSGGSTGGTGGGSGGTGGGSGASGGSSGGSGSSGSSGVTGGAAGAPSGSSGSPGGGTGGGSSGSSGPGSQGSSGGQGGSPGDGTGSFGTGGGSFPSIQEIGLGGGSGSHGSGGLIPSGGSISWGGGQGSVIPIGGSVSWGGGTSGSTGGSQGSGGVSGSGGSSGGGSSGGSGGSMSSGGGISGAGGSGGAQGSGGNQGGSQGGISGGSQGGSSGSSGSGSWGGGNGGSQGGGISWGGTSGGSQGSGGQGGSSGGGISWGGSSGGSQGGQGGGISGVGGSGGSQGSGGNQGGSQGGISGGSQGGSSGSSGSGSWGGGSGGSQGGGISWGGINGGSQGSGGQGGSSGGGISWGGGSGGSQGGSGGQGGSSGSSGSGSSGGNINGSQGGQGGGISGAGGSGGSQGGGVNQGGSQGSGQGGSSGSSGSGSWGGGSQGGGISWGGTTGGSQGSGGQGGSSGSTGAGSSGGNIDGSQGGQAGGSGGSQGSGGNQGGSQGSGSNQGGSQGIGSGQGGSGSWGGGSQGGGISWGGTIGGSQGSGGQGGSSGSFPSGGSISWGGGSGGSQGSGGGQGGSSGNSGSGSSGGNINGSQGGQSGGISGAGGSGGSQGSGGNQGGSQGIGSGQGGSGSWGGGSQGGGISWGGTTGGSQGSGGQGGPSGSFPSGGSISWGGGSGGSQGSGGGQGGSSGNSGSGSSGGNINGSQGGQSGGISGAGGSGGSQGSGGNQGGSQGSGGSQGGSGSWGGGSQGGGISWGGTTGGSQGSGGQGGSSGSTGAGSSGGNIDGSQGGQAGGSGGSQGSGGNQGGSQGIGSGQGGSGSWGGGSQGGGISWGGTIGGSQGSGGQGGSSGSFPSGGSISWGGGSGGSQGSGGGQGGSSGNSGSGSSGGNINGSQGGQSGGISGAGGSGGSQGSGGNQGGLQGSGGSQGGSGSLGGGSQGGGISWGGTTGGSQGSGGQSGSSGSFPPGGSISWGGGNQGGMQGSGGGQGGSSGSSGSGSWGGINGGSQGGGISWGGTNGGSQGSGGQSGSSGSFPSGGSISWGGGNQGGSQGSGNGQGGSSGNSGSFPSGGGISWGGSSGGSQGTGGGQGGSSGGSGSGSWGGSSGGGGGSTGSNNVGSPGSGSPGTNSPQGTGGSSSGSIGSSSSGGSGSTPSGGNVPSTGDNGGLPSGTGSGSSGSPGNNASGSSGGTGSNPPNGGTSGGVGTLPGYPGGISWGGSSESGSSGSSGSGGSSGGGVSEIPSGGTIEWGGSSSTGQPSPSGGGGSSTGSSGSSGNLGGSGGTPGSTIIAGSGGGGGGTYAPKPSKSNADASEAFLDRISMGGIAKDPEQALHEKSMEAKIIEILYNLRFSIPSTPLAPIQLDRHMIFLTRLSNEQLTILGLAKSIIPPPVRPDLISRTLGCLQGGSDFLGCTKAVVWPFLSLYIANLPVFPEESAAVLSMIIDRHASESDFVPETPVAPSPYSALIGQSFQLPYGHFLGQTVQIASRSPLRSEISAKADNQPIISVTDTRFVPIYSDHPETVILKILTAMADSIEQSNPPEYHSKVPAFITLHSTLNSTLNQEQESVIKIAEYLIPENSRQAFFNGMLNCLVESNSFQFCSRNILWPTLAEHYPRLPSFPNFQENLTENRNSLGEEAPIPISEIDVKTGQHGDTLVTITDTRFVPLFGEHPEEVIMKLLKGIHSSSPNQINTPASSIAKSPSFTSSFSSRQSDILVVAENLLPESIREIFIMRMTDCVRDNAFLDCTRDIAWPTIGQFFPRLASFPNFGTLPSLNEGKPQQPTLLPPNLEPTAPMSEMPRIVHPEAIRIQQTPESLESKIEGILNQVVLLRGGQQPGLSYLNTEDPITTAIITEEQARIIRTAEGLVPEAARPVFIVKMMDCIRGNGFPICTQAVAWPTLRQFLPNIPEFPGITNFVPELPSFSEFAANFPQLPALPNPQQFGLPQVQLHRNSLKSIQEIPGGQPEVLLPGYTASVGPAPVVPAFPGQPTDILIDISAERVTLPKVENEIKRKRRQVINLLKEESNLEIDNNKVLEPLNITEPDLLQLLINITQADNKEPTEMPVLSVESLNSTNSSLTDEQTAILGMLDKLDFKNSRGLMSQMIGCITSLSFIRCIGIFVWPLITSAMGNLVPSLPGLPFGRATDTESDELFGSSIEDLEKELWARKEEVERELLDWYKSLTEEKFEADYGLLRFVGYGDGEIGVKFGEGRQGRAKIKDHKHLPSILTIISEIMEDVLDTGRPNQKVKKDNKRGKSLVFPLTERSDNDDQIVGMFLNKLRSNLTDEDLKYGNRKLTSEDAYRAFEVLFGPRLRARLVNNMQQLYENNINENRVPLEQQEKKANLFNELEKDQEDLHRKKSALTIHLPKLDDEIISRKMTNSLATFARKMDKTTMMQMVPGVGFLLTFFLQMALAHARAAASMATMMSNMAMGSAIFSLVRQTIFGDTNHPKIKYVYDTDVNAPGISWPHS